MTSAITTVLTYGESQIRTRSDEKVNLTDMWKASGADPERRPGDWLAQDGTRRFCEYLADTVPGGIENLAEKSRGGATGGGATWAHWQLAIAYARYLSPAFHVWCNEVIRAEMQRRAEPTIAPVSIINALAACNLTVGDNSGAAADLKNKLGLYARSARISFQRAHGRLKRDFHVASYRYLSLIHYPLAREQLIALAEHPDMAPALAASAATNQLNLFASLTKGSN